MVPALPSSLALGAMALLLCACAGPAASSSRPQSASPDDQARAGSTNGSESANSGSAAEKASSYRPVPAPLVIEGSAFEAAGSQPLAAAEPIEFPGLHNLYWLSEDILSGSEPEGQIALEKLAELGIRTVLSVDGKVPDHEEAARLGMRYVHVPIRYSGIEQDEVLAIAKTFRELEGPFYVHCFHGKHRGPSAAAIGRVLLDGAERDQAIAEMRQYCGTSNKYEGLYQTIATGNLPSPEATAAFDFDFAPEFRFQGFRTAMIDLPRSFDPLVDMSKRDWQPNPDHPDGNARNEAAKMVTLFEQMGEMDDVQSAPEDFRGWVASSLEHSRELVNALEDIQSGSSAPEQANRAALAALEAVKQDCNACHRVYRD